MSHRKLSRRELLKKSASLAAAVTVVPSSFVGKASAYEAKNDRVRIACVGTGGRLTEIASEDLTRFGDIVAVCDVDQSQAEKFRAAFAEKADLYQDYRRVLERPDVDVIINATPDHWHSPINVATCQAGKDLYAEKPITLTIDEGKILSKVVEKTGRIVQVGTQQRSMPHFQQAIELVRNGRIGRLKQVWVALPYFSTRGGPFPAEAVPESLDWEMYQGQAPVHDYCKPRTHSNFRWWYEYAGGIITDWGNHHMDIAHWGMDCELTGPTSIDARGLFPNEGRADCFSTADRFFSRMKYPNDVELLYFSALNDRRTYGAVEEHASTTDEQVAWLFGEEAPEEIKNYDRNGVLFIGDQGRLFVNRGNAYGKAVEELADNPLPEDAWRVRPNPDHMANFFDCVKSREQPISTVQMQHRTISACHLTTISLRLNRPLRWDPVTQQILGDEEAQSWLSREQRKPYQIQG